MVDRHVQHFLDTILKHGILGMAQLFLGFNVCNYTTAMAQLNEAASICKMPNLSNLFLLGIEESSSSVLDLVRTFTLQSLGMSNFVIKTEELTQIFLEISPVHIRELNLTDCRNVGCKFDCITNSQFPITSHTHSQEIAI